MKIRSEEEYVDCVLGDEERALTWGKMCYDESKPLIPKEINYFIDVGANVGGFTKALLEDFPNAKGFLFEPSKAVFNRCLNRFKNNHNLSLFNAALGDKNESSTLFQNLHSIGAGSLALKLQNNIELNEFLDNCVGSYEELQGVPQEIQLMRFDDIPNNNRIDLIKIDVEGSEFLVLNGMLETIKKYMPVILLEVGYGRLKHPRWNEEVSVVNKVLSLGYNIMFDENLCGNYIKIENMESQVFDVARDIILIPKDNI